MYSTIVVGTDGSPGAREAVRQAGELARHFKATLHLVTGFKTPSAHLAGLDPQSMVAVDTIHDAETAVADRVEAMLREAASEVEGVKVETHSIPGDAAEAIISVAEREGAELIVVGSKGMSSAKRFFLGSVPNKVSHHAPCSVLIVQTSRAGT